SSSSNDDDDDSYTPSYTYVPNEDCINCGPIAIRRGPILPPIHVDAEGFAGGQKVVDSDASLSAALSLVFQHRFRINAAVSHYFENEMDGGRVTLTLPAFTVGVRLGDLGPTKLWLEGGITYARTRDTNGSVGLLGSTADLRGEHQLGAATLLATAGAMLFDDLQAFTGRVGVRYHHVEVAFKVLDFSVGPPLYGPEIGIGF
ncbi:MAG: hypothetical protein ABI867_33140, partial [Kofleriaceae bacterium]